MEFRLADWRTECERKEGRRRCVQVWLTEEFSDMLRSLVSMKIFLRSHSKVA